MANIKVRTRLYSSVGPVLLAAMSLATTDAGWAACTGPGAPTTTQTKCLTAVAMIPGNPLRSFDISWVNPDRAEYYLADRSNAGIDVIDTQTLKFKRTIGGFVGVKSQCNRHRSEQQHLRTRRRYVSWPLALRRRRRQHAQGDRSQCAAGKRYQTIHQHRWYNAGR